MSGKQRDNDGLRAHDVFWHFFMEEGFVLKIVKELQMGVSLVPGHYCREKFNAFQLGLWLGSYSSTVKRKQNEIECSRFLINMASKEVWFCWLIVGAFIMLVMQFFSSL